MQTRLSATSVAMCGAVILHVRKLQSYCSLRASEADPRPSNFVSTTDFKEKARFGSRFLLFPQLNYLCYFTSRLHQKRSQEGLPQKIPGGVPQTPQGALSTFIPTCRTDRKLLPTGLCLSVTTVHPSKLVEKASDGCNNKRSELVFFLCKSLAIFVRISLHVTRHHHSISHARLYGALCGYNVAS